MLKKNQESSVLHSLTPWNRNNLQELLSFLKSLWTDSLQNKEREGTDNFRTKDGLMHKVYTPLKYESLVDSFWLTEETKSKLFPGAFCCLTPTGTDYILWLSAEGPLNFREDLYIERTDVSAGRNLAGAGEQHSWQCWTQHCFLPCWLKGWPNPASTTLRLQSFYLAWSQETLPTQFWP